MMHPYRKGFIREFLGVKIQAYPTGYSMLQWDKSWQISTPWIWVACHRTPDPILSSWPTLPHIPSPSAASEGAFKSVRSLYRVCKRWIWGELFSIVGLHLGAKYFSHQWTLSSPYPFASICRKSLSAKSQLLGTLPFGGSISKGIIPTEAHPVSLSPRVPGDNFTRALLFFYFLGGRNVV